MIIHNVHKMGYKDMVKKFSLMGNLTYELTYPTTKRAMKRSVTLSKIENIRIGVFKALD